MENNLELITQFGDTVQVQLEISWYVTNGCLYVGLICLEEGFPEPYAPVTVNLREGAPDYCGYIDTNNMPHLEEFLVQNDIGHFTGLTQTSGYCSYPLYQFHVERLRALCPEGMARYEACFPDKKICTPEKERSR